MLLGRKLRKWLSPHPTEALINDLLAYLLKSCTIYC